MSTSKQKTARIDGLFKKHGLKALADHLRLSPWALQKWRKQGYVPNSSLKDFCVATGAKPSDVWDHDLDFIKGRAK